MVPFVDLQAQHRELKRELLDAVSRVIDSCQFALGNEVAAFEEEFAAYCNVKWAAGVNTGTSALHLALLAGGVGPGDEVITVPYTFIATAASILYAGAKPVFVDIDDASYTMDPSLIEAAITERTKAIIPVHLFGQAADMDPILAIAKRRNLLVIEDACQAHGAEYKRRRAGSLGHMAAFSFYPGKNLGACGEGGALVSDDRELIDKVKVLRDWGQAERYHHVLLGYNYRMDNLQAAVLRVKLRRLPSWTEARRRHAAAYRELLAGSSLRVPSEMDYSKHVYHIYATMAKNRDVLRNSLSERGIATGLHYPVPVHLQRCVAHLGYHAGDFPVSEKVANEELSLPMFAELNGEQIQTVVDGVKDEG